MSPKSAPMLGAQSKRTRLSSLSCTERPVGSRESALQERRAACLDFA
jgi:hypothetical protein